MGRTGIGCPQALKTAFGFLAAAVWPACTGPPGAGKQDPGMEQGARLYGTYCQSCHGDREGKGRLAGVPSHGPDGHTWHHSDRNLTEIILHGSGEMGEMMRRMMGAPQDAPRMPAFRDSLSEENVEAILAYIKTFWTTEQRRFQRDTPMMR